MKKSWQSYQKVAPKQARTSRDGIVFHSKTEKDRYEYLRLLERAGEIRNLKTQVKFPLVFTCGTCTQDIFIHKGKYNPLGLAADAARYTADFSYEEKRNKSSFAGDWVGDGWHTVVEDVKGYRDENSKLRIRIFEAFYDQPVRIVSRPRGQGWVTE